MTDLTLGQSLAAIVTMSLAGSEFHGVEESARRLAAAAASELAIVDGSTIPPRRTTTTTTTTESITMMTETDVPSCLRSAVAAAPRGKVAAGGVRPQRRPAAMERAAAAAAGAVGRALVRLVP